MLSITENNRKNIVYRKNNLKRCMKKYCQNIGNSKLPMKMMWRGHKNKKTNGNMNVSHDVSNNLNPCNCRNNLQLSGNKSTNLENKTPNTNLIVVAYSVSCRKSKIRIWSYNRRNTNYRLRIRNYCVVWNTVRRR